MMRDGKRVRPASSSLFPIRARNKLSVVACGFLQARIGRWRVRQRIGDGLRVLLRETEVDDGKVFPPNGGIGGWLDRALVFRLDLADTAPARVRPALCQVGK
jgi:hypothetical protein